MSRPASNMDVSTHRGVISFQPGTPIPLLPPRRDFIVTDVADDVNRALARAVVRNPPQVQHSNANFAGLVPAVQDLSGRLEDEFTTIWPAGSQTRYRFMFETGLGSGTISLTVDIFKDHEAAQSTMKMRLSLYQAPLDDILRGPITGNEKGQFNLEGDGYSMWIRGNIYFVLRVLSGKLDSLLIAKRIDDYFAAFSVDPSLVLLPRIHDLKVPDTPLHVESEFTLAPLVDGVGLMTALVSTETVLLLSTDATNKLFKFLAVAPGHAEIILVFAHDQTRGVVSQTVDLTIEEPSE